MNNQLSLIVKRYLLPGIIVIFGIVLIILGLVSKQDGLFMMASVNLLIGGALAILFSAGILKRNIILIIGIVCIVFTVFVAYAARQSVNNTIQHDKDYKISEQLYQYQLNEIRELERAYHQKYRVYAPSFKALKEFFESDSIEKIDATGSVPARYLTEKERDVLYTNKPALDANMTEREAALLAALGNPTNSPDLVGFKRDTIMIPYKDEYLSSSSAQAKRETLALGEFSVDKLRYIPMTDPKEEWTIETRDRVPYINNDTISTIHVYGKQPIPRFEKGTRRVVGFGNIETGSDKGSWE